MSTDQAAQLRDPPPARAAVQPEVTRRHAGEVTPRKAPRLGRSGGVVERFAVDFFV